jgi:hypothetical protein
MESFRGAATSSRQGQVVAAALSGRLIGPPNRACQRLMSTNRRTPRVESEKYGKPLFFRASGHSHIAATQRFRATDGEAVQKKLVSMGEIFCAAPFERPTSRKLIPNFFDATRSWAASQRPALTITTHASIVRLSSATRLYRQAVLWGGGIVWKSLWKRRSACFLGRPSKSSQVCPH